MMKSGAPPDKVGVLYCLLPIEFHRLAAELFSKVITLWFLVLVQFFLEAVWVPLIKLGRLKFSDVKTYDYLSLIIKPFIITVRQFSFQSEMPSGNLQSNKLSFKCLRHKGIAELIHYTTITVISVKYVPTLSRDSPEYFSSTWI